MEALIRDIRYAFRRLLSQPGSSLIILLTLAFGIGVNTSIFSLVNGVVFRDLPFKRGGDIVEVRQQALKVGVENVSASVPEIQDYREQANSLEGLVEYHFMYFFIGGEAPALVKTGIVSANYFDFLGVAPVLGRGFVASDDKPGAEPVLMLSNEFWNSQFGGDEKVIGRIVEMNGKANRVIGVLPKMPHFPEINDIYMPTSGCPMRSDPAFAATRSSRMMSVYGRLKPGVELGQAASEVGLIAQRMQSSHPTVYPETIGFGAELLSLQDELTKDIRPSLYLLLAASLLLLLITCANVVNLTLAQQSRRQKELAVRAALGAPPRDIARKLLIESMVLALAGGLGGLVLAYFSLDLLTRFASTFTSRASEVSIDSAALAFNLIVSILTGVVVGLVPVFGKQDIVTGLKEGGAHATLSRQRQAVRKILIVVQVAVAFMLVTGAGLMIRSFVTLQAIDPGFRSEGVTAVTVPLNWSKYETLDSVRNFVSEMKVELEGSPEIYGVAFTTAYPFGNGVGTSLGGASLNFDDRPGGAESTRVNSRAVSGNYFELLGIPLIEGRSISENDDERAPLVVVVNKTMAEKYWPDQSALNKRISPDEGRTWYSVVGVAGDVKGAALDKPVVEEFYVSYAQSPSQSVNVLIKSQADASRISTLVRDAVSRLDPEQPVTKVITLQQALAETMSSPRMLSQVLSLFSFIALAISMAGVSGLLAYTVSQRTREIGVRMALGAEPGFVRWLVLRQGLTLVVTGLVIGIVASLALGRLMSSLMYGTSSMDLATYIVVSLVVLTVSLAACWLPATRASRLDPSDALRTA